MRLISVNWWINCAAVLLIAKIPTANCRCQDPSHEKTAALDFRTGNFEKMADQLGHVIELKLKHDRLNLGRSWGEEWRTKKSRWQGTPETLWKDFADSMGRNGLRVPETGARKLLYFLYQDQADLLTEEESEFCSSMLEQDETKSHQLKFGESDVDYIALDLAILTLAGKFENNQWGAGGSSKLRRTAFQGKLMTGMHLRSGDQLQFDFIENKQPFRSLSVSDAGDGSFHLRYVADNLVVDLAQQTDGSVRFATIVNQNSHVTSAGSFVDLARTRDGNVDTVLFPLLQTLGINPPKIPDLVAAALTNQLPVQPLTRPDSGNGAFEELSDVMGQLVAFGWKGKNICVRRDWEQRRSRKRNRRDNDPDSLRDDIELTMLRKGCDETNAVLRADMLIGSFSKEELQLLEEDKALSDAYLENLEVHRSIIDEDPKNAFELLFALIRRRSGANTYNVHEFSGGSCVGRVEIQDDHLLMDFRECHQLQRKLYLFESTDGTLYFNYRHDQLLIDLRQAADGNVRMAMVANDEPYVFTAANFHELLHRNEKPMKLILWPLLKQIGIRPPFTMDSEQVQRAGLQYIKFLKPEKRREFAALYSELESGKFANRSQATELITKDSRQWAYYVQEKLHNPDISTEARTRLNQIANSGPPGEAERYLLENRLLDSTEFLVELLAIAEPGETQDLVVDRLGQLTNLAHGTDVKAWRDSLAK